MFVMSRRVYHHLQEQLVKHSQSAKGEAPPGQTARNGPLGKKENVIFINNVQTRLQAHPQRQGRGIFSHTQTLTWPLAALIQYTNYIHISMYLNHLILTRSADQIPY